MANTKSEQPSRRKKRRPEVHADDCALCGSDDTFVYSTENIVRYCKCRCCGSTWTQTPKGEKSTTHGKEGG